MITTLTYFGLVTLTYLFVEAEPMILIKRFFGFKEEEFDSMDKLTRFFHKLLYCHLCSGFWIGMLTGNLFVACIVSVSSEILHKIIKRI